MIQILGFSINNSYFKAETIHRLVEQAAKDFEKIIIFIPDFPARHTFLALGYEESKALQKARLKGNNLRNHVTKSLERLSQTVPQVKEKIRIVNWEVDCKKNLIIRNKINEVISFYQEIPAFKSAVRLATSEVLKKQLSLEQNWEQAVDLGLFYLLEELGFLAAAPDLYQSAVCYLYHQPWPVFEQWLNGKLDCPAPKNVSFQIFKPLG